MTSTFPTLQLTAGSTYPDWFIQILTADGLPVDLTNATAARIRVGPVDGGALLITDAACAIAVGAYTMIDGTTLTVARTDGYVIYSPAAPDVATPGAFKGHVHIDFPGPAKLIAPGYGAFYLNVQTAI